jgi:hypothetical protein
MSTIVKCQLCINLHRNSIEKSVANDLVGGDSRLVVFVCHDPKTPTYELKGDTKDIHFAVEMNPETLASPYIGVWWYEQDKSGSVALQGTGYAPINLRTSLEPLIVELSVGSVMNKVHVATLTVSATYTGSRDNIMALDNKVEELRRKGPLKFPLMKAHNDAMSDWFTNHKQNSHENDGAPVWAWSTFVSPGPLSMPPALPMFFFSEFAALDANQVEPDTGHILYLMKLALHRLHLTEEKVDDEHLKELFCEMATMLPLSMIYRNDHSGDRDIDQWVSLSAHPVPELAGYDCEDGAQLVLIMCDVLRKARLSNPLFRRIQKAVKDVEFCLCIGTLEVDDDLTWHAYVVGFERDWLLSMGRQKMKEFPLILESTDYLTSDPGFVTPFCNAQHFSNHPRLDWEEKDVQIKVPFKALARARQYHHLALVFSPLLAREHNTPVLVLTDEKSAMGVDVYRGLMDCKAVPCKPIDWSEMKKEMLQWYHWLPKSSLIPGFVPMNQTLPPIGDYYYYSVASNRAWPDHKQLFLNEKRWCINQYTN